MQLTSISHVVIIIVVYFIFLFLVTDINWYDFYCVFFLNFEYLFMLCIGDVD